MNKKSPVFACGIVLALAFGISVAKADSSCWSPAELKAYDITMQTLMVAHVAADCDQVNNSNPPLRASLAKFLGANDPVLESDRQALSAYYKRAYGADWEMPLHQSLDREESRVDLQVKQNATPQFCVGAGQALSSMDVKPWDQFVSEAIDQGWHQKAGLPACR